MPVIGRLDEQVDERIISPISNRRRDTEQPPEPRGEEDSPATRTQTPPEDESSTKTGELPVWLL
jgi:hypothetical protein